jgi:hypothetical protein
LAIFRHSDSHGLAVFRNETLNHVPRNLDGDQEYRKWTTRPRKQNGGAGFLIAAVMG